METDKKKKILVIDNAYSITGAFKAILAVAENLRLNFDFIFCLSSTSELKDILHAKKFPFVSLPFLEISKSLLVIFYLPVLLYNGIRLWRLSVAEGIDVIHVNDLYNLTGILVKIVRPRTKLIYHVRLLPGSYNGILYPLWLNLILTFADNVICNSVTALNAIEKESRKIKVIYDLPPAYRYHVREKQEVITLLYLSNFTRGKGQNFALDAFANVIRSVSNVRLIFSGGDFGKKGNKKYKQELIERTKELGIEKHVIFTPFESDVERALKNATIFLNFSESESLSLTCMEALFSGVPLIATDSGGPSELFEHGKSGLLVKNRNVEEMTNAILLLCGDETLRKRLAKNGFEHINAKFSATKILSEYASLYSS